MKTLTLLFTFLISFPLALSAQSAEDVLQKVSVAMTAESANGKEIKKVNSTVTVFISLIFI